MTEREHQAMNPDEYLQTEYDLILKGLRIAYDNFIYTVAPNTYNTDTAKILKYVFSLLPNT